LQEFAKRARDRLIPTLNHPSSLGIAQDPAGDRFAVIFPHHVFYNIGDRGVVNSRLTNDGAE
jgi:hypothetical protein